MANIDTYLQQIMAAIYGEDVRGSIHNAIEAINDQVDAAAETMEQFVQGAMDTTLTSTTKPAQGKAVGDAVNSVKSALIPYHDGIIIVNNISPIVTEGYYANSASAGSEMSIAPYSGRGYVKIPVKGGAKYAINMDISANFSWWAYDSSYTNGTSISKVSVDSNHVATAPSNATILYITIPNGTASTGLVVLEQDIPIYGATIDEYPRGTAVAVDIPELRNAGTVDAKIDETLKKSIAYTWDNLSNAKELINLANVTDGEYVKASDGTTASLSGWSVTDFIAILPDTMYRINGGTSGSQIAFYDENKVFITSSGIVINTQCNFKTPDKARYLRWCSTTSKKNAYSLKISDTYLITTAEGLLNGMISAYALGVTKVEVAAGTYNLINEYTAKYGADYFTNYTTNYNGLANGVWDRGLWLDNVKIVFNPGAKVECKYNPSGDPNSNVRSYFSPFAVGVNVEIIGLVLDSENCRYGLHPDFNGDTTERTFFIMRNCDLKHFKSSWSQAIGAGLGIHSDWLFENCIFRSDSGKIVVRIHNNSDSSAQSTIVFRGCYVDGSGWIQLNSYSTSVLLTRAIIEGCSWITAPVVGKETEQSQDNITLIAWCNETRQS